MLTNIANFNLDLYRESIHLINFRKVHKIKIFNFHGNELIRYFSNVFWVWVVCGPEKIPKTLKICTLLNEHP